MPQPCLRLKSGPISASIKCTSAAAPSLSNHVPSIVWSNNEELLTPTFDWGNKDDAICKNCFIKVKHTGNTTDMPNPFATPRPKRLMLTFQVNLEPWKPCLEQRIPSCPQKHCQYCKVHYLQRKVCHASKVKALQCVEVYIKTSLFGFSKEQT